MSIKEQIRAEIERRLSWRITLEARAAYNNILRFLDTLPEQPVEGLEEAAQKVEDYYDVGEEHGYLCCHRGDIKNTFIAGAEWQKAKMLEDAVEGVIIDSGFDDGTAFVTMNIPDRRYDRGDKVRVIVIK